MLSLATVAIKRAMMKTNDWSDNVKVDKELKKHVRRQKYGKGKGEEPDEDYTTRVLNHLNVMSSSISFLCSPYQTHRVKV